jgi:glycosyltransferase involved in cell wall biosynthesis
MLTPSTLSVTIITLNENAHIRACLDSVSFADEIIVVDSGSTDQTCQIAREYTENVYFHKMRGFGAQKQYALDQASGDWILSLDADERVTPALRESLLSLMEKGKDQSPFTAYTIYRRNVYLGRAMRYCGWYIPILRLLRKGCGHFNEKLVHEEILADGPVGHLDGDILHVPYRDIFHHLDKMRSYASLDATQVLEKGRKVYGWRAPVHLVGRPAWKFVEKYLLQQGFRDGVHGLILSAMASLGVFLIYVQCWHLQRLRMNGTEE